MPALAFEDELHHRVELTRHLVNDVNEDHYEPDKVLNDDRV